MKKFIAISLLTFLLITSGCYAQQENLDTSALTIALRYEVPEGYLRVQYSDKSFMHYCQNLPLKPYYSEVKYYNGKSKPKSHIYSSVIDMPISPKDLQQCADATMRIYGEYLYSQQRYQDIKFNFVSDGKPRYFTHYAGTKRDYKTFRKYMDYVFAYANTRSLYDQLSTVQLPNVQPGDVIITKGNPYGHAVIVLDVCKNNMGKTKVLLAQSYMPAQETQVLKNPHSKDGSDWYQLQADEPLITPEWTFNTYKIGRYP